MIAEAPVRQSALRLVAHMGDAVLDVCQFRPLLSGIGLWMVSTSLSTHEVLPVKVDRTEAMHWSVRRTI